MMEFGFVLSIYLAVLGLLWLCSGFLSCRERGCSVAAVRELVTMWLLLCNTGSSALRLQQSWHTGLAAPRHVELVFPARD